MNDRPHVLYHAFGGGLGHAVRTLALARQVVRLVGGRHRILVNTPFARTIAAAIAREPGLEPHCLSPTADPADAVRFLRGAVREFDPDLFVVDTFPAGLVGELFDLFEAWSHCPRVLISRGLPRAYVDRHGLVTFAARHYDLILAPGETSPFAATLAIETCPPFLVRDANELRHPAQALELLDTDRPVVLIAGSGTVDECIAWRNEAAQLAAVWPRDAPPLRLALPGEFASPPPHVRTFLVHFPLIECLPGVRLLIASAGYNLVHETRALGIATLFRPQPRRFDDQSTRLHEDELLCGDLLSAIRTRLASPPPAPSGLVNGAVIAARRIVELPFPRGSS